MPAVHPGGQLLAAAGGCSHLTALLVLSLHPAAWWPLPSDGGRGQVAAHPWQDLQTRGREGDITAGLHSQAPRLSQSLACEPGVLAAPQHMSLRRPAQKLLQHLKAGPAGQGPCWAACRHSGGLLQVLCMPHHTTRIHTCLLHLGRAGTAEPCQAWRDHGPVAALSIKPFVQSMCPCRRLLINACLRSSRISGVERHNTGPVFVQPHRRETSPRPLTGSYTSGTQRGTNSSVLQARALGCSQTKDEH